MLQPNLIIQTAFLGDLLLAIPLFRQIRKNFPDQKLYLVCREGLGSLFFKLNLVDKFYEIKKNDRNSYKKIFSELKNIEFENLLCPHQSFRSALFSYQIRARKKISYETWWNSIFFGDRVPRDTNLPDALRQMSLLSPLIQEIATHIDQYSDEHSISILGAVPDWASMDLGNQIDKQLQEQEKTTSGILYQLKSDIKELKYACLFPGSVWRTKQWELDGFADIARRFTALGYKVILLGSLPEKQLGEYIFSKVPGTINLIAKTNLLETLIVLRKSEVVITNDSAGQHLAAAAGAPTVSIFGPTVLELGYRPWNPRSEIIENKDIQCRPCGKHGHKDCPIGTHQCMKSISADQVWNAIERQKSLK